MKKLKAQHALRDALGEFGYPTGCVRFDWPLPNVEAIRQHAAGEVQRLGVLAFADELQQTWETTLVAADLRRDGIVGARDSQKLAQEMLKLTAAPVNIVGSSREGKVDIWFRCYEDKSFDVEREVSLNAQALTSAFKKHRADVQRERLAQLRLGQRHLFDGYIHAQRDDLANHLQQGVSAAFALVSDKAWGDTDHLRSIRRAMFSRVAIALLAARILEDKGPLGKGRSQTCGVHTLLGDAKRQFDSFFDRVVDDDLPELARTLGQTTADQMAAVVLAHLTGPVTFGLVTHEALGDLNERALVAERQRAEARGKKKGKTETIPLKGVHYTPRSVTRQILERIPIEDIPVADRCICDFAAGSGSFLLSATERLEALYDCREPGAQATLMEHLATGVLGNDIDPVSELVVELSYLDAYWQRAGGDLGRIPRPNWHKGDALLLDPVAAFGRTPSVIVGNPPFDIPGKPPGRFLLKALDLLEGQAGNSPHYVGMIMPGAFLTAGGRHKHARDELMRRARILEVWQLPQTAIGLHARQATCAVIAEVGSERMGRRGFARVCQTTTADVAVLQKLRDLGIHTRSFATEVTHAENSDEGGDLAFSPVDDIWARLFTREPDLPCVEGIAETVPGFRHFPEGDNVPEFRNSESPGCVPFIRRQKPLKPYFLMEEDWLASHGEGEGAYWVQGTGSTKNERLLLKYTLDKILLPGRRNQNARSQLIAAVDFSAIRPGKDFKAILLRPGWTTVLGEAYGHHFRDDMARSVLLWLCCTLNSPVGHAWYATNAAPRGVRSEVALRFPLPSVYDPQIPRKAESLARMTRPPSLGKNPTWDPDSGMTHERSRPMNAEDKETADSSDRYWQTVGEINQLVMDSYDLKRRDREGLTSFLEGMTAQATTAGEHPADLPHDMKLRVLRGRTLSISAKTQKVGLSMSWTSLGRGKPVRIPFPGFMPGWALERGREFTCRAPENCTLEDLRSNPWLLRDFRPIPYSYLDKDELERMIGYEREER